MADLVYLALAAASFLLCWAYLVGLERLNASKGETE